MGRLDKESDCSVEASMQCLKLKSWVEQARMRKWKWAAKMWTDGQDEKWSKLSIRWNPQLHHDAPRPSTRRRAARPNTRWLDDIVKVTQELSPNQNARTELWRDPNFWTQHEDKYTSQHIPVFINHFFFRKTFVDVLS